ncbi:BN159_2729 family protein [Streptomyces sp. NBC_01356]|uniref:BN159_2729 family protein n=1 Tax=Streptomyces sp. NBC_01356 TaxID=2903836 RepID=UPI002E2F74B4|nr:BN159_2729 family protein [Streptomyces sp. NBC_01356]
MNRNLPHAARVIRTVMEAGGTDPVTAAAHALDGEQLLVDPEKSYGIVLHRTATGGWSRGPRQMTELERQAHAWDTSCRHARLVAAAIEQRIGRHQDFQSVQANGDQVRVVLLVSHQDQWKRWRSHFGITHDGERLLPDAVIGECLHEEVRVSVVAYELPPPSPNPRSPEAARAFEFGGRVYDLTVPQCDAHGQVWYFQGWRGHDGMPLLSLDGRPERCSLPNVAAHLGPLTPVQDPLRPVVADAAGELEMSERAVQDAMTVTATPSEQAR